MLRLIDEEPLSLGMKELGLNLAEMVRRYHDLKPYPPPKVETQKFSSAKSLGSLEPWADLGAEGPLGSGVHSCRLADTVSSNNPTDLL